MYPSSLKVLFFKEEVTPVPALGTGPSLGATACLPIAEIRGALQGSKSTTAYAAYPLSYTDVLMNWR